MKKSIVIVLALMICAVFVAAVVGKTASPKLKYETKAVVLGIANAYQIEEVVNKECAKQNKDGFRLLSTSVFEHSGKVGTAGGQSLDVKEALLLTFEKSSGI